MTQLIFDGIQLPESEKDGYCAWREELSVEKVMANSRLIKEIRGGVWRVRYQYGYFDTEMKNKVLAACEKAKRTPVACGFLVPNSDGTLKYSRFFLTSMSYPMFMWSRNAKGTPTPMWADFSFELREVEPSD